MREYLIGFGSGIFFTLAFIGLAAILYKPPPMLPPTKRRPF